jgi:hypothetical protein
MKDESCLIISNKIFMRYDLIFFLTEFTLHDSYKISFYRMCSYESNNICRIFSI